MFNFKIDDVTKWVALVSAALYASGFLIVNSNLATYGDIDPDFTSSRYVFSGFLFAWYMIPVTFFVFKYVFDLRSIDELMETFRHTDRLRYWTLGFQLIAIEPAIRICIAAMLFGQPTLEGIRLPGKWEMLIALLFFMSLFIAKKWQPKRRWKFFAVISTIQVAAVCIFIAEADTNIKAVAISYVPAFIIFVFAIDPLMSKQQNFESRSMSSYYLLSSIALIITFGTQIYGHVKHQHGGGSPVSVTVYMKNDIGTSELTKNASGGFLVDMIALNDKKLIGVSGGKHVVLNADGIASIVYP